MGPHPEGHTPPGPHPDPLERLPIEQTRMVIDLACGFAAGGCSESDSATDDEEDFVRKVAVGLERTQPRGLHAHAPLHAPASHPLEARPAPLRHAPADLTRSSSPRTADTSLPA